MAIGRFSTFVSANWMDQMESDYDKWLSMVFTDPHMASNPHNAEVSGGTVNRMPSSWTRTSTGLLTLASAVVFVGLPPGTLVAGVAGFDSSHGGNLLFSDMLDVPVSFIDGGTYVLPAGEYVIGLDVIGV